MQSMAAKHSIWPREKDIIFNLSARAQNAEKTLGRENVINATIGALMNDDGNLITMDTVYGEYKALENKEISAYAALEGQADYLEAAKKVVFGNYTPEGHIRAVASPGGTGAIKLATWAYTDIGDEILTSDWFWSPYISITEEIGRKVTTYKLFDEDNNFNFESYKERFLELSSKQERVFTILNTPAHNPTGYSISDDEWDKIIELSKEVAKNPDKKIIFFVDIAYMDFASDDDGSRKFFEKFSNLPENVLVIVGFSMSKGFTAYGMRMGAAICISSSENVAEEFHYACVHSGRANWSNCNRGAMKLLSTIVDDEEKFDKYMQEKTMYKEMLKRRAKVFVEESERVGLEILPYRDGFFVSIPCENSRAVCEELTKQNLYMVPLKAGLRFAVCAVNESKCQASPSMIKKALDYIKNQELVTN